MRRVPRRRKLPAGAAGRERSHLLLLGAVTVTLLMLSAGLLRLLGGAAPADLDAVGGSWSLTGVDGRAVSDRDLRGRYLLIYFGYASCPDVCPTALSAVAEAMHRLGEHAARLQPIFISIDPGHDSPPVVGRFAAGFGARVIGLTGTAAQIRAVEREFRVVAIPRRLGAGADNYTIDHTSVLLLIGPDGRYLAPLSATDTGAALAERLRQYVASPAIRS